MLVRFTASSVLVVMTALTAIAQMKSGGPVPVFGSSPAFIRSGAFFGGNPMGAIAGHPFSGLEETQTVQTLWDGTHVTQGNQKVMYYRDSLGRTRTERTSFPPPGFLSDSQPPVFVEINDPVAGYRYTLDPNGHSAYRAPSPPVPVPNGSGQFEGVRAVAVLSPTPLPVPAAASRVASQQPRPETSVESLGTQTMEGVLAEGVKTTTVWPAGLFGNDRPITTVNETWTWKDLGIAILTKNSDPRSGETTMRMTRISQAEPDPALFQLPAGYEINDPSVPPTK